LEYFFYIFKGRLLTTIERKLSFLSNSPEDLYELLPKFQQERHWCFPEVVGILLNTQDWVGWEAESLSYFLLVRPKLESTTFGKGWSWGLVFWGRPDWAYLFKGKKFSPVLFQKEGAKPLLFFSFYINMCISLVFEEYCVFMCIPCPLVVCL